MRQEARLTQHHLGDWLGRPQRRVHISEVGNRCMDLAEIVDWGKGVRGEVHHLIKVVAGLEADRQGDWAASDPPGTRRHRASLPVGSRKWVADCQTGNLQLSLVRHRLATRRNTENARD